MVVDCVDEARAGFPAANIAVFVSAVALEVEAAVVKTALVAREIPAMKLVAVAVLVFVALSP